MEAAVAGYLDFRVEGPRLLTLRLITDSASYGGESKKFGVAVRSVSVSP